MSTNTPVYAVDCPHCGTTLYLGVGPSDWCPGCDLPVLLGYHDDHHVVAWCPHCRRDHRHGHCAGDDTGCRHGIIGESARIPCTCPLGSGSGHRVAHCDDRQSPYADSGYIVIEVAELAKVKR